MTAAIPDDVLSAIRNAARTDWEGDLEMQRHVEQGEIEAWTALQSLSFGKAYARKDAILAEAADYLEAWEDRLHFVRDEIEAFEALETLEADDIPSEELAAMRARADAANDWYALRLDDVRQAMARWRYVRDTRARVAPARELLVRMEEILGSECYNANIQNYSAWGVWEGEGRSFRYPVTYLRGGSEEKRRSSGDDLTPEELLTGHYRFGANQVGVMRALMRMIEMLRDEYGLALPASGEQAGTRET